MSCLGVGLGLERGACGCRTSGVLGPSTQLALTSNMQNGVAVGQGLRPFRGFHLLWHRLAFGDLVSPPYSRRGN